MAQDYKTINCTCGKELISVEGNIITDMCNLCPMKMNKYYIKVKGKEAYVEVIARTPEHARGCFMREYYGKFDSMTESEPQYKNKGYNKTETLVRKYSGTEIEDKYPPGHPARKKSPRRKNDRY